MVRVFLDTSVLVRYFAADDEAKFEETKKFVERVLNGEIIPYISSIVMLELFYVLNSIYKLPKQKCIEVLEVVRGLRNCILVEKTNFDRAMVYHKKYKVKLTDCVIATQIPKQASFVTYDKEFLKIKDLKALDVVEFI